MRLDFTFLAFTLLTTAAANAIDGPRRVVRVDSAVSPKDQDLFKRKGGGGGGGRGGGGGGGGSSSGGGSSGGGKGGGSSGGSGGSSGTGGGPGNRSPQSNGGGTSAGGSGPRPAYGGGRYYGGGSTTPYRSGGISPLGIVPFALAGTALAFWPGIWLYHAYMYPYHNPYRYYNESSNRNETRNVLCGCEEYAVCGCDDNNNTAYYDSLIGNGSYDALNKSVVNVAKVNGTDTILINGTLPNGTTADGPDSDDSDDSQGSGSPNSKAASMRNLVETLGYWPAIATVLVTVFLA